MIKPHLPTSTAHLKDKPSTLSVSIPFEDIIHKARASLDPSATKFTLNSYPLSSLPDDFFNLNLHLTSLDLRGNFLNQLPTSIFQLTSLKFLYLGENCFETLPTEMENFKNLAFLDLSENKFKTLRCALWLRTLSSLQVLDLRGNQLTSLPNHIGFLSSLRVLLADGNPWTSYSLCLIQKLRLKKHLVSQRLIYEEEIDNETSTNKGAPHPSSTLGDDEESIFSPSLPHMASPPLSNAISQDSKLHLSEQLHESTSSITPLLETANPIFQTSSPATPTATLCPRLHTSERHSTSYSIASSRSSKSVFLDNVNTWGHSRKISSQNTPTSFPVTSPITNMKKAKPIISLDKQMYNLAIYTNPRFRTHCQTEKPPLLPLFFLTSNLKNGALQCEKLVPSETYTNDLYSTIWFLKDLSETSENWLSSSSSISETCSLRTIKTKIHPFRRPSAPDASIASLSLSQPSDAISSHIRKKLFSELIKTEITYVAEMAYVIENYRNPFLTKKLLSEDECAFIFSRFEDILNLHKDLFFRNTPPKLDELGQFFQKHLSYLQIYTQYIESYENVSRVFRGWVSSRKNLKRFIETCRKNPNHRQLDFESFLFLPIQRVLRYKLFIEAFLKNTSFKHPDFSFLLDINAAFKSWAQEMNEKQRARMESEKVVEAYSNISGSLPLLCPTRRLIRSGELHYVALIINTDALYQINMSKTRYLFLFNDMLAVCKEKRKLQYTLRSILALEQVGTSASIESGLLRIVHDSRILYFSGPPRLLFAWVENINNRNLY